MVQELNCVCARARACVYFDLYLPMQKLAQIKFSLYPLAKQLEGLGGLGKRGQQDPNGIIFCLVCGWHHSDSGLARPVLPVLLTECPKHGRLRWNRSDRMLGA